MELVCTCSSGPSRFARGAQIIDKSVKMISLAMHEWHVSVNFVAIVKRSLLVMSLLFFFCFFWAD